MKKTEKLTERKLGILKEIAALGPMRKGSLTEQFLETKRKDGTKTKRGPYLVYTFKEKGKTLSRRIKHGQEEKVYRKQIATFRHYQELSTELVRLSGRIADLAATETGDQKKTSSN